MTALLFSCLLCSGLPGLPTVTSGTQNVEVTWNGSLTLAAGSYGALNASQGATILFAGRLYQFASWNVGQNAKLHFSAPSEVQVIGEMVVSQNAFVGPASGATNVDANRIVLLVAGTNGQSNPGFHNSLSEQDWGDETPHAVSGE